MSPRVGTLPPNPGGLEHAAEIDVLPGIKALCFPDGDSWRGLLVQYDAATGAVTGTMEHQIRAHSDEHAPRWAQLVVYARVPKLAGVPLLRSSAFLGYLPLLPQLAVGLATMLPGGLLVAVAAARRALDPVAWRELFPTVVTIAACGCTSFASGVISPA